MSDRGGLGGAERTMRSRADGGASGPDGDYWMDAGGRWRSGQPPADWRQDSKGRWHPTKVPDAVRAPEPAPVWQPPIGPPVQPPLQEADGADPGSVRVRKRRRGKAPT